jgi:hypothetical protein
MGRIFHLFYEGIRGHWRGRFHALRWRSQLHFGALHTSEISAQTLMFVTATW